MPPERSYPLTAAIRPNSRVRSIETNGGRVAMATVRRISGDSRHRCLEDQVSDKYLIGVDLGTSATKAALYRLDGTLVAEASAEVPLYYPKPGVVEQENDDFYRTAAQTVQQCLSASGMDPRARCGDCF